MCFPSLNTSIRTIAAAIQRQNRGNRVEHALCQSILTYSCLSTHVSLPHTIWSFLIGAAFGSWLVHLFQWLENQDILELWVIDDVVGGEKQSLTFLLIIFASSSSLSLSISLSLFIYSSNEPNRQEIHNHSSLHVVQHWTWLWRCRFVTFFLFDSFSFNLFNLEQSSSNPILLRSRRKGSSLGSFQESNHQNGSLRAEVFRQIQFPKRCLDQSQQWNPFW